MILSLLLVAICARGVYTSFRLLLVHLQQYGWAGLEAEAEAGAFDRANAVGKLLFRSARLVISALGLTLGVIAVAVPPWTKSPVYAVLVIMFIFGGEVVVDFINEYEGWLIALFWPWRRRST